MFCTKCGNKLNQGQKFCTNCGSKQEIQNFQYNNSNVNKTNKLIKIIGIIAAVLPFIGGIIAFCGILLIFPDPISGESVSGLHSFEPFGICVSILFVISIILGILVAILNIIESKRNKRSD